LPARVAASSSSRPRTLVSAITPPRTWF
jgi:hypothetical protein